METTSVHFFILLKAIFDIYKKYPAATTKTGMM